MTMINVQGHSVKLALVVVDVQNGFVSKGGSYDQLGIDISRYQNVIPKISELIKLCRSVNVPIFYTQAVRERSGIDLLTNTHRILPKLRDERIRKKPICVINTWDAGIVNEIKPSASDHIVIKRRDSAFQDTEIGVWLKSIGIDILAFCGIDTSICVEASLRDAFNNGYDVILISDATASSNIKHFESTLEVVRDYYGLVMDVQEFARHLPQKPVQRNKRFLGSHSSF